MSDDVLFDCFVSRPYYWQLFILGLFSLQAAAILVLDNTTIGVWN